MPHYLQAGELSAETMSAKEFLPYFDLKIPPLCDIMTALVLSFMLGVGMIFIGSGALKKGFDEFGEIIKLTIEKAIIPLLPWYIFTMICEMSAKGVISVVLGSGAKIILTGVVLTLIWLVIQYCIAGAIAGKNPFKCLWNMLPAYLTAFSICSSSATIPVTSACAKKNGLEDDIVDFTIPLCSTVHMCGSTIKLAVSAIAVAYIFGVPVPFAVYVNFVLMQGIAAVAAPGVMGGVLMASVGLLESIMGFTPDQTALVMTLYLALDGYGPGCNVTGDGAIAIVIDKLFKKK
jgi:Na+/H+-dicarboxylate symporter